MPDGTVYGPYEGDGSIKAFTTTSGEWMGIYKIRVWPSLVRTQAKIQVLGLADDANSGGDAGGTFSGATSLSVGGSNTAYVGGASSLDAGGNVEYDYDDYYKFSANAGTSYKITLDPLNQQPVALGVYHSDYTRIMYLGSRDLNTKTVYWHATDTEDIYVRVRVASTHAYGQDSPRCYNLEVASEAGPYIATDSVAGYDSDGDGKDDTPLLTVDVDVTNSGTAEVYIFGRLYKGSKLMGRPNFQGYDTTSTTSDPKTYDFYAVSQEGQYLVKYQLVWKKNGDTIYYPARDKLYYAGTLYLYPPSGANKADIVNLGLSSGGTSTSTRSICDGFLKASSYQQTFEATIQNLGQKDVTTSFYVGVYVDGSTTPSDTELVSALGLGKTVGVSLTHTFSSQGTHSVEVKADINDAVSEYNERNNVYECEIEITGALSDLIVDAVSPTTVTEYELTNIYVTIKNQGTTDITTPFWVYGFYDSNAHFDESIQISSLASGASTTITWTHTFWPGPTHRISVVVDAQSQIAESDETNNRFVAEIKTRAAPLPDLIIADISVEPTTAVRSSVDATIAVQIANSGGQCASSWHYRVVIDDDSDRTYDYSGTGIGGGSWGNFSSGHKLSVGSHTIKVVVDINNELSEADESNNYVVETIEITKEPVDLEVTDIIWSSTGLLPGRRVEVIANVANTGAGQSNPFQIEWQRCKSNGEVIESCTYNVGRLDPGETDDTDIAWEIYRLTLDDSYVKVLIDTKNENDETNEANNEHQENIPWGSLLPDLAIRYLSWSPENPTEGQVVTFNLLIYNAGNSPATDFTVNLSINNTHYASHYISNIDPGTFYYATYTYTTDGHEHLIKAELDSWGNVTEYDEANNEIEKILGITSEGLRWTDPEDIAPYHLYSLFPVGGIGCSDDGDLVVVFHEAPSSEETNMYYIYAVTYDHITQTWSSPYMLDSADNEGSPQEQVMMPQVAMSPNGKAVATWVHYKDSAFLGYAYYSYFDGTSWTAASMIASNAFTNSIIPIAYNEGEGKFIATFRWSESPWPDPIYHDVYSKYTIGSGWSTPQDLPTGIPSQGSDVHFAFSSNGNGMWVWVQSESKERVS